MLLYLKLMGTKFCYITAVFWKLLFFCKFFEQHSLENNMFNHKRIERSELWTIYANP